MAYSFDASRQLVVLDSLGDDDRGGSVLCARHAHAMVLPKGWWLDDQRVSTPTLFTTGRAAALEATSAAVSHRPRRRREPAVAPVADEPSLPMAPADATPSAPGKPVAPAEPPAAVEPPGVVELSAAVEPAAVVPVAPVEPPAVAPLEPEAVEDGPADEVADAPIPAWTPNFDDLDDIGLLQVDSPLLSRAFGAKGSQGARRRRSK